LAFVENCDSAGKTVSEVVEGLVNFKWIDLTTISNVSLNGFISR